MTRRTVWAVAVAAALVAGVFRAVHLGTPSLWWDELVHIRIAAEPPGRLWSTIKWGPVPRPTGNAGAMPLDYVLLHAYRAATPAPPPARLEAYWRTPAWLYSVATVVVLTIVLGRHGGVAAAAVGGSLLALSVPAALYAAEARPYSLLVLLAALTLLTLDRVATAWGDRKAWVGFAVVALLFVGAGLTALPVLAASGLVLLVLAAHRRRLRMAVAGLAGTALAVFGAALAWFHGIDLAAGFGRLAPRDPGAVVRTLSFLTTGEYDHPTAVLLLAVAPAFAIAHASRRTPRALPLLAFAIASFAALPALLVLIRWKDYYFHVRHAVVLLPALVVVLAHACLGLGDMVARGRPLVRNVVAAGVVVALVVPPAAAFVREPYRYFAWTKTVQDWKSVADRLEDAPAGRHLLLVAGTRTRADERATYVGAWYLRVRGLDRRVLFCATTDLAGVAYRLEQARRVGELDLLAFGCTPVLGLDPPGSATEARTNLGALTDPQLLAAGVAGAAPPPTPDIRRFAFVTFEPAAPATAGDAAPVLGLVVRESVAGSVPRPTAPPARAVERAGRGG